ncbi:hypothetical protein ACFV7Q_35820 [Streptomyces sp. NPDC059851]|uniref:hypothetical protein n=1 Tax=Streptomyces sp. NPDC059851 TaxID=3346971 RepID=UPI003662C901
MLFDAENTLFVRGAHPALLLADAPVHDALPVLVAPDGRVPVCEDWTIAPMLTLCLVDGPGGAGIVVPAFGAVVVDGTGAAREPDAMAGWCSDVEQEGGVLVLSLASLPAELDWAYLIGSGTARGGFVPVRSQGA